MNSFIKLSEASGSVGYMGDSQRSVTVPKGGQQDSESIPIFLHSK